MSRVRAPERNLTAPVVRFSDLDYGMLCDLNVLCLEALRSLFDFELNGLSFLQAAEAFALDFGVVDEYVSGAIRAADEAKAFRVVKPFHCSLFHKHLFLST
jgi:hypothetical protein